MSRGGVTENDGQNLFAAACASKTTTTMRTGPKLDHHHHRQGRTNDGPPAEILRGGGGAVDKEARLKASFEISSPLDGNKSAERQWERSAKAGGEKNVWTASSQQSQSSGYGSNGTPSSSSQIAAPAKPVTVLRPNRQTSDRENGATPTSVASSSPTLLGDDSGGGDGIDAGGGGGSVFAAIARGTGLSAPPSGWRKQALGSAVPFSRGEFATDILPNGDENAFPALPSRVVGTNEQQSNLQRGPDSPKIVAATVAASSTATTKSIGRPASDRGSTSSFAAAAAATTTTTKSAPTLATPPVDYARKLTPIPQMTDSVKIVDEMFQWRGEDPLVLSRCGALLENPDFLVIGVVGPQGAGKSTLLAQLAGVKGVNEAKPIFKIQSDELVGTGSHQTAGVDMFITSPFGGGGCGGERIILLDTQPLFSVSVLDNLIHHDRKYPQDFTSAENCVYMQSIHLLGWLLTTCHVVIVVQDWFVDMEMMKAILTAEMLKPSLTPVAGAADAGKGKDEEKNSSPPQTASSGGATVIFVQNKASPEEMTRSCFAQMQRCIASVFASSKLNVGTASSSAAPPRRTGSVEGRGGGRGDGVDDTGGGGGTIGDVNLFLLPEIETVAHRPPAFLGPTPAGDFHQEAKLLRKKILGLKRKPALFGSGSKPGGGNAITERTWLRQAGKIWEGMKKASLMLEYNRLLT